MIPSHLHCFVFTLQTFRFKHWSTEKAEYKASFKGKTSGAFECKPATIAAGPAGPEGLEMQVEVTFEPSSTGNTLQETLLVSSPVGGEHECLVKGRCLPPKPSGPFEIVKVCYKQLLYFYAERGIKPIAYNTRMLVLEGWTCLLDSPCH